MSITPGRTIATGKLPSHVEGPADPLSARCWNGPLRSATVSSLVSNHRSRPGGHHVRDHQRADLHVGTGEVRVLLQSHQSGVVLASERDQCGAFTQRGALRRGLSANRSYKCIAFPLEFFPNLRLDGFRSDPASLCCGFARRVLRFFALGSTWWWDWRVGIDGRVPDGSDFAVLSVVREEGFPVVKGLIAGQSGGRSGSGACGM